MTDQQNGPAELRAALEAANAAKASAEQELRALKTEVVFKEARVPLAAASLYNGEDLTVEAVTEWATSHAIQIGTPTPAPDTAEAVAPGAEALPAEGRAPAVERIIADGPTAVEQSLASIGSAAGSHQATAGQAIPSKLSHAEFSKMLENPATRDAATKAYIEGRVERNPGNVQADQMQAKGIIR